MMYHATTTLGPQPDAVPWCSSFVNFCIVNSGLKGTNSAMARFWGTWGREIDAFVPGCVVVLRRGDPPRGHVGFYVAREGDFIRILGGNQRNAVNIASFDVERVIAKRLPSPSAPKVPVMSTPSRWDAALFAADTTGASAQTAGQDGLPPGIESSQKMAERDLSRAMALRDKFHQAGVMFAIPPALLAAIASRESRCGRLAPDGTGDRGHAFGIMQIDKSFHTVVGGPTSLEHIEQAAAMFASFRSQVQRKHPIWADKHILKGAVVAYNAGVGNVQTIQGMDTGTTGDDYGSDVIARAQFYARHLG